MIGVVVVTHGQLARELVSAAETIVGDLPGFGAGFLDERDRHRNVARMRFHQPLQRVALGQGGRIVGEMEDDAGAARRRLIGIDRSDRELALAVG